MLIQSEMFPFCNGPFAYELRYNREGHYYRISDKNDNAVGLCCDETDAAMIVNCLNYCWDNIPEYETVCNICKGEKGWRALDGEWIPCCCQGPPL